MKDSANDERGRSLDGFLISLIIIPTIAIILRFWSRSLVSPTKGPKFWWDDWVALAAWAFGVAMNAIQRATKHLGVEKHLYSVPPKDVEQFLKLLFVGQMVYVAGLTIIKTSVLLFYVRVFSVQRDFFRYALWITQGLVLAWFIAFEVVAITTCSPIAKLWLPSLPGHCRSLNSSWMEASGTDIFLSLVVLLLPMPMVWRLHLRLSRKILISAALACGYCVIVVALGRLISIALVGSALNEDITYAGDPTFYWLEAEMPLSVVSICLPSIFYFVNRGLSGGPSSLFHSRDISSPPRDHGKHSPAVHPITHKRNISMELDDRSSKGSDRLPLYFGPATTYRGAVVKDSQNDNQTKENFQTSKASHIQIRHEIDVRSEPRPSPAYV